MRKPISLILTVLLLFAGKDAWAYKFKRHANTNSLSPLGTVYFRNKFVSPQTTQIGVKASAEFFDLTSNKELTTNSFSKQGISVGIYANILASKHVSMRHELALGYGVFQKTASGYASCTRLDIPWSINYHFSRRNLVNIGIQPSLILNSRVQGVGVKEQEIATRDIESLQVAGFVGMELGLKNNVGLGARMLGYVNKQEKASFNTFLQIYLSFNISESTYHDKKLMSYGSRRQQSKTKFRY